MMKCLWYLIAWDETNSSKFEYLSTFKSISLQGEDVNSYLKCMRLWGPIVLLLIPIKYKRSICDVTLECKKYVFETYYVKLKLFIVL
jgi:hypothetical protein